MAVVGAFLAGAAFLAAGGAFLAGTAFLTVAAGTFLAGAFLAAGAAVFFAAGAAFLVELGAFFTTRTAFFFERTELFVVDAPTLEEADFFPLAADDFVRDPDTRLTWVLLPAGVIPPSFEPCTAAGVPDDDRAKGAGDHTGPHCGGQYGG